MVSFSSLKTDHPHPWFDLPQYNCWSSQLLATCLVFWGSRVTLPSGRLRPLLVHPVNDDFGPKQFTCVHQLHPHLCCCPLAHPCQCQPTGETVPSAFGPFGDCCFHHSCSSCNGDLVFLTQYLPPFTHQAYLSSHHRYIDFVTVK